MKYINDAWIILILAVLSGCTPSDPNDPEPTDNGPQGLTDGRLLYSGYTGLLAPDCYFLNVNTTNGSVVSQGLFPLKTIFFVSSGSTVYYAANFNGSPLGGSGGKDSLYTYDIVSGTKTLAKAFAYPSGSTLLYNNYLYKDSLGTIICYDAGTYDVIWKRRISNMDYSYLNPLFNDNTNLYHTTLDSFFALSLTTGNINWKRSFGSSYNPYVGNNSILIYSDGAGTSQILTAVSKSNGSTLWTRTGLDEDLIPIYVNSNRLFTKTGVGTYALIDISTGNNVWTMNYTGRIYSYAIADNKIFILSDSAKVKSYDLANGNFIGSSTALEGFITTTNTAGNQFMMIAADTAIIFNTLTKVHALGRNSLGIIWTMNKPNANPAVGTLFTQMQLRLRDSVYYSNGTKAAR